MSSRPNLFKDSNNDFQHVKIASVAIDNLDNSLFPVLKGNFRIWQEVYSIYWNCNCLMFCSDIFTYG